MATLPHLTPEQQDILKKEIRFRAGRRGMKELDLLLGSFVNTYLNSLPPAQLPQLCQLLQQPEHTLFCWLMDEQPVPEAFNTPVFQHLHSHLRRFRQPGLNTKV